MKYYSLNHNAPKVSFREAVIQGLAPDKGLYFPDNIPKLSDNFFENIENHVKRLVLEKFYIYEKTFRGDKMLLDSHYFYLVDPSE